MSFRLTQWIEILSALRFYIYIEVERKFIFLYHLGDVAYSCKTVTFKKKCGKRKR